MRWRLFAVFAYLLTPFVLVAVCLSFASAVWATPTLWINNTNKPPYTTAAGDGCIDRVAEEAFERIGVNLRLTVQPPERGLQNANSAKIDGDLTRIDGIDALYPNLRQVEEPLFDWHFAAFSADPDTVSDWHAIYTQPVGHIKGWKIYEAKLRGAPAITATIDETQLFRLLMLERVKTILYERWQGRVLLRRAGLAEVHIRTLETKPMYIYLHKRHAGKVRALAQSLREMKRDGFYREAMRPCRQQEGS